jgi:hypothetical protein
MPKVYTPTDDECELLEKMAVFELLTDSESDDEGAQSLYEADLLEQIEGWVEDPEEASDDELDNGICLLEDRISKFEKTKTEEPRFGTWAIETQLGVYELWLKNLRDEKEIRHDGEVRVMTEEEVQNDPEMTAQVEICTY